jgi:8-oxo-dGTP diphosphatase
MTTPQFGEPEPGRAYRDRPAAFGIVERAGEIALVRVAKAGHPPWLDLPGGAIDPGEDAAQAVVREFGEETGLRVAVAHAYARADQYFVNTDGEAFNNRGTFLVLTRQGEDPALKIEDDHTLVWMAPDRAVAELRHDAHAWAVAAWLRLRRRA